MEWQTLKSKVDAFCDVLTPGFVGSLSPISVMRDLIGLNFKQLWEDAREIQAGFNAKPRFPTREEREECWSRFNAARGVLAEAGKRERESRENSSRIHYDTVMGLVNEAGPNGWDSSFGYPGSPDLLKEKGKTLRKAGAYLSEHKQSMTRAHKDECFAQILKVRADLDERWRVVKSTPRGLSQSSREKIETNIRKNEEGLAKNLSAQASVEANLAKNRATLDTARGNFRSVVEGWIREGEERLASMKETEARYRQWLADGHDQLRR